MYVNSFHFFGLALRHPAVPRARSGQQHSPGAGRGQSVLPRPQIRVRAGHRTRYLRVVRHFHIIIITFLNEHQHILSLAFLIRPLQNQ